MKRNWNNVSLNGIRPSSGGEHNAERFMGTLITESGERLEVPLEKEHVRELGRVYTEELSVTVEISTRQR